MASCHCHAAIGGRRSRHGHAKQPCEEALGRLCTRGKIFIVVKVVDACLTCVNMLVVRLCAGLLGS